MMLISSVNLRQKNNGTVKNNMKGYERNHRGHREKINSLCSPNNELCNFTGTERELKRIRYFYKNESLPMDSLRSPQVSLNPCFNL